MDQNSIEKTSGRTRHKRIPVPVTLVAALYLAVGVGGFILHFSDRRAPDWIWVEAVEFLAIICGVYLLRASNWARWLACAWMALHLVISFGEWPKFAIHALFLVLIVWGLFRADASRFFQDTRAC